MDNLSKNFLLAGNATFTVQNEKTGKHFTYRVRRSDDEKIYFVTVLAGSDVASNHRYIGTLGDRDAFRVFRRGKSSAIPEGAQSVIVFKWLWAKLTSKTLPDCIKILHTGKCCRCGRKLTTPDSIKFGMGPTCLNLFTSKDAVKGLKNKKTQKL